MTVDTPGQNLPATVNQWGTAPEDDDGLGDLSTSDLVIPRLKIVGKESVFQDTLSNEKFDAIDAVILGLIKQRILWHPTVDKDDKPMCKSNDFAIGVPTLEGNPANKLFPWKSSNFTRDAAMVNPTLPTGQTLDTQGHPVLPCGSCRFKDWDTHPNGGKPWCNELHTLPVMYRPFVNGADPLPWTLAILTFKSSGLTPSKKYLSNFKRINQAPYTAITRVTLTQASRGETIYSIPNLSRVGTTEKHDWPEYAGTYQSVRDYARQLPRPNDRNDNDSDEQIVQQGANVWGPPVVQQTSIAQGAAPVTESAVATPAPTRQEQQATVAATPPAPAPVDLTTEDTGPRPPLPVAAVAPAPAPVAPAPVPAAPAPVAAAPAPAPVAPVAEAPTPAPVAPAPAETDPNALPF